MPFMANGDTRFVFIDMFFLVKQRNFKLFVKKYLRIAVSIDLTTGEW